MSDTAEAALAHSDSSASVSVPAVVLASVLVGVGLIGTAYWLITFNWLYFLSLAPLTLGAVLLFTRLSGPDHA